MSTSAQAQVQTNNRRVLADAIANAADAINAIRKLFLEADIAFRLEADIARIKAIQCKFEQMTSLETWSALWLRHCISLKLWLFDLAEQHDVNLILSDVLQSARWKLSSAADLTHSWILSEVEVVIKRLRLEQFRREFNELVDASYWHSGASYLYWMGRWNWVGNWEGSIRGKVFQALQAHGLYSLNTSEILTEVRQHGEQLIKQGELINLSPTWILFQAECIVKKLLEHQCFEAVRELFCKLSSHGCSRFQRIRH